PSSSSTTTRRPSSAEAGPRRRRPPDRGPARIVHSRPPHASFSREPSMPRWWILAAALAAACSSDRTGPGLPPPVPTGLVSTSLDGAVALAWDDNAFTADPARFQNYRVFSTTFDIDADPPRCGTSWLLEGSTVAPEFLVGALENGRPRCFAVSAVSVDQAESARSEPRGDTPRPDARNVAVYATQVRNEAS